MDKSPRTPFSASSSRQAPVHSPSWCYPPSIDVDTSILIIPHTRLTTFAASSLCSSLCLIFWFISRTPSSPSHSFLVIILVYPSHYLIVFLSVLLLSLTSVRPTSPLSLSLSLSPLSLSHMMISASCPFTCFLSSHYILHIVPPSVRFDTTHLST